MRPRKTYWQGMGCIQDHIAEIFDGKHQREYEADQNEPD